MDGKIKMEQDIKKIITKLQEILTTVRQISNKDDFLKKPGKYLGPAITLYADFLRQIGLSSFNEFMEKVAIEGKTNATIQDVIEELWELEETWDTILKDAVKNKVFMSN